jgi:hypothetical protein
MTFNRFYQGIDSLLKGMRSWERDCNYWIGVSLRKSDKGGKKVDCFALTALYSDVDYGQDGHRKKNKWQTKGEALAAIQAFPLRPSILIHSGGGFQPYWLLKEPVGLENGNYAQIEAIMKGLNLALGGDVGTQDISRILRLPGTFNMKLAGTPRPVEIVWCEPERVYNLADFAEYKPQPQTETPKEKVRGTAPKGPQPPDLEALNIPAWAKTLILTGATEGYPSRSERDHAVIGELLRTGCNLEIVEAIYQAYPVGEKYREKGRNGRTYLQASIEKILSAAQPISGTGRQEPGEPPVKKHNFTLVSAAQLIAEPCPETSWIWEEILPQGGSSLVVAKPKVGKTTLGINLAIAVARGDHFLGRPTAKAPVVYLALEEKRSEINKALRALNVGNEPLFFHFGLAPKKATEEITNLLAETGAGLLVIDTLQKFARVKDLNDYAQVTAALEPIHAAARQSNCHILLMHHAGKGERTDGDEVLGSTGILGGVDTCIILKKRSEQRTFSTIQRYGKDLPETIISLISEYFLISEGTLSEAKRREVWQTMKAVLEEKPGLTEPEIVEILSLRKGEVSATLHWAGNQTPPLLNREGQGRKGNPYKYLLPILPPLPHYIYAGEKPEKPKNNLTCEDNLENSPPIDTPNAAVFGEKPGGEFDILKGEV